MLTFCDPNSQETWEEGQTSVSVILYGFVRSGKSLPPARCRRGTERLLERLGISISRLKRCLTGPFTEATDGQCSLDFPSS